MTAPFLPPAGLLPPRAFTMAEQKRRVLGQLKATPNPLEKYNPLRPKPLEKMFSCRCPKHENLHPTRPCLLGGC